MKKVTSIVLNPFTNDSRVLKENLSLKKAGYDVKILALYKKGLNEFEEVEGIPVYRIKPYETSNKQQDTATSLKKYKERILNEAWENLSFKDKLFRYVNKASKKVIGLFKRFTNKLLRLHRLRMFFNFAKHAKDSDIIHCNDLYTLPMGYIVKKFYNPNVKIVYDAHEYETEVNGLKGWNKLVRKIMERFLIHHADIIMTVSDSIAEEYAKLYKITKPYLVLNTPPFKKTSEKKNLFRKTFNIPEEKTIFLYQGSLTKGRGVENILEAFKTINKKNAVIIFMGYGYYEEHIKKAAKEHDNIFFHPAVSPNILLDYTASADFGISMIENICLSYYYCLPNKMFEYIMAEVPVIVSNLPEMSRIVNEFNIGVIADSNDTEGLKKAIHQALSINRNELVKNIQYAKKIFNWEEQEKILLEAYSRL